MKKELSSPHPCPQKTSAQKQHRCPEYSTEQDAEAKAGIGTSRIFLLAKPVTK
jgi:hypothetical protein